MLKVIKRYCIHVKVGSNATDPDLDPHEYPLIWHGSVSGSRSKEITKIFKKSDFHLFKNTFVLTYVGMYPDPGARKLPKFSKNLISIYSKILLYLLYIRRYVSGSRSKEITKIFKKSDFHLFKKTFVLTYVGMFCDLFY
jgi:hypothetical protein